MRTLLLTACALLLTTPLLAQDDKEPDLPARLKALKVPAGKPFTLIVHLHIKKDEVKTILAAARPCITATRKETGCISYEMHQNLDDPTRFVFYERWKSVKALQDHLAAEHTQKLVGTIGKIVASPPVFSFYINSDDLKTK